MRHSKIDRRMAEMGHSRRIDMQRTVAVFRFTSNSVQSMSPQRNDATCIGDKVRRSKKRRYSIASLARSSNDVGIVMPSALAVFRLITNSYLVGASIGNSLGFSPLAMRST